MNTPQKKFKIKTTIPKKNKKIKLSKILQELRKEKEVILPETVYPSILDKQFNTKITLKKEFLDNQYRGFNEDDYKNIEKKADELCKEKDFELESHQKFVRNFMSFQTPYNSLLLYHELGTGKTCSSIQVCEDMRNYLKNMGINKKIIIIASPTVQENYKLQLFDERKLKLENGLWNIKACVGNKFINEINPMLTKNIDKTKLITQIKKIIKNYYQFLGYTEFSNYIKKLINSTKISLDNNNLKQKQIDIIKNEFSNKLIVIDEVHNIRVGNKMLRTSEYFLKLVKYADNMKLLFLTATPMYNSYEEIIWLTNLMNLNDNRFSIKKGMIFDKDGNFKINKEGKEIGRERLTNRLRGYVSYVKGNNPFMFPFSIYPHESNNKNSLKILLRNSEWNYPLKQINGSNIKNPIQFLDLYMIRLKNNIQYHGYNKLINKLKQDNPILTKKDSGIQYTMIGPPLQLLNFCYPIEDKESVKNMYGKTGLLNIMSRESNKRGYEYKEDKLKKYGRIFSYDKIGNYSKKIKHILFNIKKSKGIIMIYSQYLEGGCIPMALALEELGLQRYGNKSLFKTTPPNPYKFTNQKGKQFIGKYIMITGDQFISSTKRNKKELKASTNPINKYGEQVKVVIISQAGSEGLDFKNIRQIHLLEPWYNLNRTKQTIGRSVRKMSHCLLPFKERNVQIFLYGTELDKNNEDESLDLYMYRYAENKAIQIRNVLQILKENAVDCVLNKKQNTQFPTNINIELSNGYIINNFDGQLKDNSLICDFDKCNYTCNIEKENELDTSIIDTSTYNDYYIIMNIDVLLKKIKNIFKTGYVFTKYELFKLINYYKSYDNDEIYMALDILINDKNQFLKDMLNRSGNLVNIGEYYMFQPLEVANSNISLFERQKPVSYKTDKIEFKVPSSIFIKPVNTKFIENLEIGYNNVTNNNKHDYKKALDWIITSYNIENSDIFIYYYIEYLIETESFNNKIKILNNYKLLENENLIKHINRYFNQYKLNETVYAFPNENNKEIQYSIITKNKNNEYAELKNKYYVNEINKKYNLDYVNKEPRNIGYFDTFRNSIVYRLKDTSSRSKGRGKQCSSGLTKEIMNNILKKLLKLMNNLLNKNIKYKDLIENKFSNKIYCNIIYYLLKYLDENNKEKIKYSYNLLENFLLNIHKL